MVRKTALIVATLILFPLFSGCWSRNEIEGLAIIDGMGIDTVEKEGNRQFLLTLSIIRPSLAGGGLEGGAGKGQPVFWRVTAVGSTLAEAERNINLRIPRRVFYGHLRFAVISEEAARHRLTDIIDYLHRHRRIRPRLLILLTDKKASDTFISYPELETTIAREVDEMHRITGNRISKVNIMDLAETTDELITPGLDPVIARLTTPETIPTEPGGKPLRVFRFVGGGVFRVDKFVGWLEATETRGYLLAIGHARQSAFSLKLQQHSTPDVSVIMTQAFSKIKVDAHGEEVTANIEIRAEGDLMEYHETNEIATNEGMKLLEKQFRREIEKEVMSAVEKAKKMKADIFGLGATLHRKNPKAWKKLEKDWYDVFPKIKVNVKVIAHIRRTGMISDPFKPE